MTKPKPAVKSSTRSVQSHPRNTRAGTPGTGKKAFFLTTPGLLILILVITFLAFLPSLSNLFITTWDDNLYVTENPLIRHLGWVNIKGFFTTPINGTYVPLPLLTWALEFKLFGLNPFPFHLDNLLLHLFCTSLIFYLFLQLRLPGVFAAFGALLFGIHPMHVESVAWITERKDLLFSVFYLGSLIAYIKYISSGKKKVTYLVSALVFFIISLFSKIQAVSLPLCLLLLDYWFDRPVKWTLLWEKIPFFLLSIGFGLAGYYILQQSHTIDIHDKFSLADRILLALFSFSAYIFKLVMPLNLSAYYPLPVTPGQALPVWYYLNLIFIAGFAIVVYRSARKTKAVVFGSLFFLFNVMFLLQVVRAGQAYQADRFTYVPYAGLVFLAAWAAEKYAIRNTATKNVITGLAIVFTLFFFSSTFARNRVWKDSITLWNDVIGKFPGRIPTAYSNRGISWSELGQMDKAITDFTEAIRIDPKSRDAYASRGNAYGSLGQWNEEIADCSKALEIDPKCATAFCNRGIAYCNTAQWDKAITDLTAAIAIDPKYVKAYSTRGVAYGNTGQWNKEIEDCSIVIGMDPDHAKAYYNRGIAYSNLGLWEKAMADFSSAVRIDPGYTKAISARDMAYRKLQEEKK
jgi:protein O-mannosyl-transferase